MTEAIILKKVYVYIVFTLKIKIWNHNKYDAYKRFVFVSQKKKTIQTNKLSSNYIIADIGGLRKMSKSILLSKSMIILISDVIVSIDNNPNFL